MTHVPPRRSVLAAVLAVFSTLSAGCTVPETVNVLYIEPGRYEAAFDAAIEAARANRLPAALRDRRGGVIETEPEIAPSLLEPWVDDGSTLERRVGQTISLQRRRARFEFTPYDAPPPPPEAPPEASLEIPQDVPTLEPDPLRGPDLLGLVRADTDRTAHDGPMEIRVRVYVEQSHNPGVRRDTWTRSATSRTVIYPNGDDEPPLPAVSWTPVVRDHRFEQRLLAAVARILAEPETPAPADE